MLIFQQFDKKTSDIEYHASHSSVLRGLRFLLRVAERTFCLSSLTCFESALVPTSCKPAGKFSIPFVSAAVTLKFRWISFLRVSPRNEIFINPMEARVRALDEKGLSWHEKLLGKPFAPASDWGQSSDCILAWVEALKRLKMIWMLVVCHESRALRRGEEDGMETAHDCTFFSSRDRNKSAALNGAFNVVKPEVLSLCSSACMLIRCRCYHRGTFAWKLFVLQLMSDV